MANQNEQRKTNAVELSGYVISKRKNEKGQGTFVTLSVFGGREKTTQKPLPRKFIDVGFFGSREKQAETLKEQDYVNVKGALSTVSKNVPGQEKNWSFLSVVGRSAQLAPAADKKLDPNTDKQKVTETEPEKKHESGVVNETTKSKTAENVR